MEIIKLFLQEKQILYFPKGTNSHCHKHRSQAFQVEEGATYKYKEQLSLASGACGQNKGWSTTSDSKHTKNTKKREVGRRKAKHPGAFKFNRLRRWGRRLPSSAVPASYSKQQALTVGGTAGNPTQPFLVCREQFWLRLLLLPHRRAEGKDFPTVQARALTEHALALDMQAAWGMWGQNNSSAFMILGFWSLKKTSSFHGRYLVSTSVSPVKTTSLLLMAELSTTSSVTWSPSAPSECQPPLSAHTSSSRFLGGALSLLCFPPALMIVS